MTLAPPENLRPRGREVVLLALAAVAYRVAVFAAVVLGLGVPVGEYADKGDGESYLLYAASMCGEIGWNDLDVYHHRVFPGFPALIAAVHAAGVPLVAAGLAVTWTSAGVAAALAAAAFDDRRVGYAAALLVPHSVINSSLVMSEAVVLAFTLGGLLLVLRGRRRIALIAAGALLGYAGLIRPMACFAVLGALFVCLNRDQPRRWIDALLLGGVALLVVTGGYGLLQLWTGDAAEGAAVYRDHPGAYDGRLFNPPFASLLATPGRDGASIGQIVYIWLHVAAVLFACGLAAKRLLTPPRDDRDALAGPWLVGNTLFVLCVGHPWGFRHFPRFSLPAGPALFWTLRRWLPRHWGWWVLIAAALFPLAVFGVRASP